MESERAVNQNTQIPSPTLILEQKLLQTPVETQEPRNKSIIHPMEIAQKQFQQFSHPPVSKFPKNMFKLTLIVFTISLSSFYYGFSLTYLSTIPKSTLIKFYGNIINNNSTMPILIGAMPVGGIFGSLLANIVMRQFTRRNFLAFVSVIALVINLLIQVTNVWVLLFCRLITGILVGLFMGIVPLYINQLCPRSVSGTLGSFTQMQHLFGNVVSYFFGMIFYVSNFQGQFMMRYQFQFTSLLIITQLVCILIGFIPQSPNSLIQAGNIDGARQVLEMFNQQKDIDKLIAQKILQNGKKITDEDDDKSKQTTSQPQATIQNKKEQKVEMNWRSYLLSFQLPFTQQFTGVNFIVTQMTQITAIYDQPLSHFTGLIANFTQFVATLFSAYILARVGRRVLILLGSGVIGIMDVIIGVVFLQLDRNWGPGFPLGMSLIMIFNVVYGLSMGPVVWLYIPQIAKKKIVPLATATYWVGCSICVIVAPIITNIMNTPYAVFLFFGVYEIVLLIPNWFLVVQTKGLNAAQISQKFKQK